MTKNQTWTREENELIAHAILKNPNYRLTKEAATKLSKRLDRTYTSITSQACKLGFTNQNGPENCEEYLGEEYFTTDKMMDEDEEEFDVISEHKVEIETTFKKQESQKNKYVFEMFVEAKNPNETNAIAKFSRRNLEAALQAIKASGADQIGIPLRKE